MKCRHEDYNSLFVSRDLVSMSVVRNMSDCVGMPLSFRGGIGGYMIDLRNRDLSTCGLQ